MRRIPFTANWLSLLVLFFAALPVALADSALCLARTPYAPDEVVHIALPMWLGGSTPHGWFRGRPSSTAATTAENLASNFFQPAVLATEMYVEMMRARDFKLPLPNGRNVTLNFV